MRKWLWLCVLVACKGGGAAAPDAGDDDIADAAGDDAPIDAMETGPIDLDAIDPSGKGTPDPTATMICVDATGAVVHDDVVDAQGHGHCNLPDGGMVTVLQVVSASPNGNSVFDLLTTFRSVKPHDHLHVGRVKDPTVFTGTTDLMTGIFTLPAPGGVTFTTPCGSTTPSGNQIPQTGTAIFTFFASCKAPTFDLFAFHTSTTGLRTFVWQPDIPHVPDDNFTIADTWQPLPVTNLTLANVPANAASAGYEETIMVGTLPVHLDFQSKDLPAPGSVALPMQHAPNAGRATIISAAAGHGIFQRSEGTVVVTHGSVANLTVDLAAMPVPVVDPAPVQTQTTVTWAETGAGDPDMRKVYWAATWSTPAKQHKAVWEVIEDPKDGHTSTTLPGLPAAHADEDPTVVDPLILTLDGANVTYMDYDNLAGYDQARPFGVLLFDATTMFLDVDHRVHTTTSRCVSQSHGPC